MRKEVNQKYSCSKIKYSGTTEGAAGQGQGQTEGRGSRYGERAAVWHRAWAQGPLDFPSVFIASSSTPDQLNQEFLS